MAVSNGRYGMKYLTFGRLKSYIWQLESILKCKGSSILEIGPGPGVTTNLLRTLGYDVQTFDHDKSLGPTYHGDIRDLSKVVRPKSVDIILVAQVLEHLPFKDFSQCLSELAKVARNHVVISLPFLVITVQVSLRWGRRRIQERSIGIRIPCFWKSHPFDGQHHWEVGKRRYGTRRVREVIKQHFHIIEETLFKDDLSQLFFILKPLEIPD